MRTLVVSLTALIAFLTIADYHAAASEKSVSLFNGKDLVGWHDDIPAADKDKDVRPSFVVRDGMLVSLGTPRGHLITDKKFSEFKLLAEYRFPGKPGNCGILVHGLHPACALRDVPGLNRGPDELRPRRRFLVHSREHRNARYGETPPARQEPRSGVARRETPVAFSTSPMAPRSRSASGTRWRSSAAAKKSSSTSTATS